jgi:protein gp37
VVRTSALGSWSIASFFGDAHWRNPLTWDRSAAMEGRRHRVFHASMADVFDNEVVQSVREGLWLVPRTSNLDWIVLTKRVGNAPKMLSGDWGMSYRMSGCSHRSARPISSAICRIAGHSCRGARVSIEPRLEPVRLGGFARSLQRVINDAGGDWNEWPIDLRIRQFPR